MTTIRIRDATVADHAAFARLFLELRVDDAVHDVARFEAEMVKTTIIAVRDGKVVGYAFFRPMKESSHLSQIVTAPDARRNGVGAALITEVVERSKMLGCSILTLNVQPKNTGAIALYESFGLARAFVSRGLRFDWSVVDALPPHLTPYVSDARDVDPAEDERIERTTKLATGVLADQRARPARVLRVIEKDPSRIAVVVFDTTFPGAYPFRAPDGAHALSLLCALRSHARKEDPFINIMIEDDLAIADALVANGAVLRLDVLAMRGSI